MSKAKATTLKLTPRGRHAVMALVELAQKRKDGPIPLSQIARTGNISLSYLEQLFTGLRRNGLVRSYRGPGGGYVLAREPKDIPVAEILLSAEDCAPAKRREPEDDSPGDGDSPTHALWSHIGGVLHAYLQGVSLEDVTNDNLRNIPSANKLFESAR